MRYLHVGVVIAMVLLWVAAAGAQQPNPPGQAVGIEPVHQAYLFAHMMHEDYGRLYYSISLDGLHWTALNDGRTSARATTGGTTSWAIATTRRPISISGCPTT